ncbi:hypothetical protein IPJ72_06080 [Candidatus Peregrinibacteria bacterium]|nr:MAG: hypothetical protein IPJ72_06080 [Candidatus Peregrinibacteria bacterium]
MRNDPSRSPGGFNPQQIASAKALVRSIDGLIDTHQEEVTRCVTIDPDGQWAFWIERRRQQHEYLLRLCVPNAGVIIHADPILNEEAKTRWQDTSTSSGLAAQQMIPRILRDRLRFRQARTTLALQFEFPITAQMSNRREEIEIDPSISIHYGPTFVTKSYTDTEVNKGMNEPGAPDHLHMLRFIARGLQALRQTNLQELWARFTEQTGGLTKKAVWPDAPKEASINDAISVSRELGWLANAVAAQTLEQTNIAGCYRNAVMHVVREGVDRFFPPQIAFRGAWNVQPEPDLVVGYGEQAPITNSLGCYPDLLNTYQLYRLAGMLNGTDDEQAPYSRDQIESILNQFTQ